MFTGIVQAMGCVAAIRAPKGNPVRLVIDAQGWDHRPEVGASISVSGCCLTVAEMPELAPQSPSASAASGPLIAFDIVAETLSKTTLGSLAPGSRVNLERSLRAADLMGGHLVQGHVDGVGVVERVQTGGDWRVWIKPPSDLMEFMTPKGSVSVEGVSLTLAGVEPAGGTFQVALIPTTLDKTTLADLKAGDRVNLEGDVLAKTIVHWLRQHQSGKAASQQSSK